MVNFLQRLGGFAPQTPQQGVAPAPHQGTRGPLDPKIFSVHRMFLTFTHVSLVCVCVCVYVVLCCVVMCCVVLCCVMFSSTPLVRILPACLYLLSVSECVVLCFVVMCCFVFYRCVYISCLYVSVCVCVCLCVLCVVLCNSVVLCCVVLCCHAPRWYYSACLSILSLVCI